MSVNLYKYHFISSHISPQLNKRIFILLLFHHQPNTYKEKLNFFYSLTFQPPPLPLPLPNQTKTLSTKMTYLKFEGLKFHPLYYLFSLLLAHWLPYLLLVFRMSHEQDKKTRTLLPYIFLLKKVDKLLVIFQTQ